MKVRNRNQAGFTLIEIGIVVAIVGLLATIATPTWVRARSASQTNTCINNLKQIDGAKQQWALDTKHGSSAIPLYSDISGYLKNSVFCPAAGTDTTFVGSYQMNDVGTKPACTIVPLTHVLPETTQ
jgi:prepilin-type N-terminal cleavage/methylation domain-containing protein